MGVSKKFIGEVAKFAYERSLKELNMDCKGDIRQCKNPNAFMGQGRISQEPEVSGKYSPET